MNQLSLVLDAPVSRALADEGIQRAQDNSGEWASLILAEAKEWLHHEKARGTQRVTIEYLRGHTKHQPASHKAWGAVPRILCKAGLIEPARHDNGDRMYRPAAALKTHAHPVALWNVL